MCSWEKYRNQQNKYLLCVYVHMALSAGHEKLALGDMKISAYLNEMRILRI